VNTNDDRTFLALDCEEWAIREKAFTGLFNEGWRAVATLVAGAAHSRPRVRAACVALMDHLADERCCRSLEYALHDASPLVRRHAVHTVGCQGCKVQPLSIDVVAALIERALNDSSPRVRRVAVHQLGLQPRDARAIEVLRRVIAESKDAGLVSRATHALSQQHAAAEPPGTNRLAIKPCGVDNPPITGH
jgi:HEAT repeat protein